MSEAIRVGIIGCGGIAGAHVGAYKEVGATVSALTDVSKDAMNALMEAQEINAECFGDYRQLIDSGLVDAVSICTPPVAHEEAALYALEKGIHVLCEKPLANTPEAAKKIKSAVTQSDSVFMVAFRHRFLPAIQQMKSMIDEGKIGAPVMFQNVFGGPAFYMKDKWFCKKSVAGGGCMLDTSSHSVDLFRFMIGEVVEQHAVYHTHFEGTDVEDAAILTLKADNGALATMGSGFVLGAGMAFIDITGQEGRLIYDYCKPTELKYLKTGENDWQLFEVEASNGFKEEITHFFNVIQGKEELAIDINDGIRCQEIIQNTYK